MEEKVKIYLDSIKSMVEDWETLLAKGEIKPNQEMVDHLKKIDSEMDPTDWTWTA